MKNFLIIFLMLFCVFGFSLDTNALRVKDSIDVDLGRLAGGSGISSRLLIITDSDYIFTIIPSYSGGIERLYPFFDDDNCTGIMYIEESLIISYPRNHEKYVYFYNDNDNYYIRKNNTPEDIYIKSQDQGEGTGCIVINEILSVLEIELIPTIYSDILNALVFPLVLY